MHPIGLLRRFWLVIASLRVKLSLFACNNVVVSSARRSVSLRCIIQQKRGRWKPQKRGLKIALKGKKQITQEYILTVGLIHYQKYYLFQIYRKWKEGKHHHRKQQN